MTIVWLAIFCILALIVILYYQLVKISNRQLAVEEWLKLSIKSINEKCNLNIDKSLNAAIDEFRDCLEQLSKEAADNHIKEHVDKELERINIAINKSVNTQLGSMEKQIIAYMDSKKEKL